MLEIMVCLVIIGFIGSVVARNGYELLVHYQFRTGVQMFSSDIQRFQILAMTLGCDVTCQIKRENGVYQVLWRPDALVPSIKKGVSYQLKGVQNLQLQNDCNFLEFTIFSTGRISEAGVLTFFPKTEKKALHIDLLYPIYVREAFSKEPEPLQEPSYPEQKKKKDYSKTEVSA